MEYIEASHNITLAEMIKMANESGSINCLEATIVGFFCDVKKDISDVQRMHTKVLGHPWIQMTPQYFNTHCRSSGPAELNSLRRARLACIACVACLLARQLCCSLYVASHPLACAR